ncbi:MAG: Fe-S-containing protein [Planctomycetota bacterium]|jgi:uncharacterized membrane protein|nr:Fe-S-containing protein [Planctomycetota bacterium]
MLKYIIAVTNTALPVVLVIGVFLAFHELRAGDRSGKPLRAGFWLGAIAALTLVLLKKNTGFVVREYYNLALLFPALAAEALLVLLAWVPLRNPLEGRGRAWFTLISAACLALWVGFALPDILFYPYDFPVGMDSIFNTRYAYKVIGYSIGLVLALLALYATLSIFRQFSPRVRRILFQAVLLVHAGRQFLTILQILLGRNLIPRSPFLTGLIIAFLNRAEWFLFVLMAIGAAAAVAVYLKNRAASFIAPNPALVRKLKAAARRQKRWCAVLGTVFVAALLSVTVGAAYENREVVLEPPKEMAVRDGMILLPLEMIDDGKLHRFRHEAPDGTEIRYIVIKKNETAFGVGLDACDVCGATGYYERNGQVVCILCDVVMNKSTIGFPGGCNPVPLSYRVEEGRMRIEVADLEKDAWRFKK